jgi:hypothetical protein
VNLCQNTLGFKDVVFYFTIKIVSFVFTNLSIAHWFFTEPGFTVEDNDGEEHVSSKDSHSSDEDDNKSEKTKQFTRQPSKQMTFKDPVESSKSLADEIKA